MIRYITTMLTFFLIFSGVSLINYLVFKEKEVSMAKNQDAKKCLVRLPKIYMLIGCVDILMCVSLLVWMIFFPNGTGSVWAGIVLFSLL